MAMKRQGNGAYRKRREQLLKYDTVCYLCGRPIDRSLKRPDPMAPEADHEIPVARGGDLANGKLRLAHAICNRRKGALTPEEAGLKIKKTSGFLEELLAEAEEGAVND